MALCKADGMATLDQRSNIFDPRIDNIDDIKGADSERSGASLWGQHRQAGGRCRQFERHGRSLSTRRSTSWEEA